MRDMKLFNDGWIFEGGQAVHLPHNALELPFSYFDERAYQREFVYEKTFSGDPSWSGKDVCLQFDGAMANATVTLNGETIASHRDGFTPFLARLTGRIKPGDNHLEVRLDGSEAPDIPPFGGVIDYLTYAGIYRDVWLRVTAPVFVDSVKIETPDVLGREKTVSILAELGNPGQLPVSGIVMAILRDGAGNRIAEHSGGITGEKVAITLTGLTDINLWDLDAPHLYSLEMVLQTPHGEDRTRTSFGFRHAEFTPQGFRLNGRPLKIRGLNRHQSFPYSGYGLGRAAQERDAEILKHRLKLNLVRTSHYPQSPWFLDRCDQLGLLVFEEIPGWQHIGGDAWKQEAVENVGRMIRRDWNHPSIVIWGVRINESRDDHDFYVRTNQVARALDPTRPTGGVRYITDSELLEDVYTMNDFILGNEELGGNRPRTALRPQREVTGLDRSVPYLITEFGGHMYPTKSHDQEQRQAEHVMRHLEVLDAAYGDPEISGAIGWCAFDYNTHKDFGSGDRICHHGVMDMFREPKFAADVYASQCDPDDEVILRPVTFWARGERNIGGVLPLVVLTNCDEVELVYGAHKPKRVAVDRERFPNLPHAPAIVDRRHFTNEELGSWGMEWSDVTINGLIGGKVVATRRFVADPVPAQLELMADAECVYLHEEVRIVVRMLDQAGNRLPFLADPVHIGVSGPGRLLGPELVPLRAGVTGFWIRADAEGEITVKVGTERTGPVSLVIPALRRNAK